MILATDYPFLDIFGTMVLFFAWVIWIWTLVMILTDVFRRSDLTGWGKAGWTLLLIVLPFLGVLAYLIAHGREIGERDLAHAPYRGSAAGGSAAGGSAAGGSAAGGSAAGPSGAATQIAEAKSLLDAGAIDEQEFAELKRRALR